MSTNQNSSVNRHRNYLLQRRHELTIALKNVPWDDSWLANLSTNEDISKILTLMAQRSDLAADIFETERRLHQLDNACTLVNDINRTTPFLINAEPNKIDAINNDEVKVNV